MQDPLNISFDLQNVNTQIPLVPEGDYLCQVKESTIAKNKDGTGHNWELTLGLASPTTSQDGREVKVDFPFFVTTALQPAKDAKDPEGFKRGITQNVDAIFKTDMGTRPTFNQQCIQDAVGKMVIAQVYTDEYPKGSANFSNKVRRLKKAEGV